MNGTVTFTGSAYILQVILSFWTVDQTLKLLPIKIKAVE